MLLMEKGGNYEYVADAHYESFIMKGYAVADGVPLTPEDKMAALKEENEALNAEVEALKQQVLAMTETAAENAEAEAPPVEKPKKSKKAKSE